MNLLLVRPDEVAPDEVAPDGVARLGAGRRWRHVRDVLKARPGARLQVGVLGSRWGTGHLLRLDEAGLELELELSQPPPPAAPVRLVLALPRPKVLRRLLGDLAALGVKEIVLVHAFRVEKSYWQSPFLEEAALREIFLRGLEQARDTVLPTVELRPRFRPFVEDELPARIAGTRALVAHPAADQPCPAAPAETLTLAIGPEGGFIPFEIELLQSIGFEAVSLGPRILRVETAVPYLLGRCLGG